jgi:hypothetical protein
VRGQHAEDERWAGIVYQGLNGGSLFDIRDLNGHLRRVSGDMVTPMTDVESRKMVEDMQRRVFSDAEHLSVVADAMVSTMNRSVHPMAAAGNVASMKASDPHARDIPASRPEGSAHASLRYAAHSKASVWQRVAAVADLATCREGAWSDTMSIDMRCVGAHAFRTLIQMAYQATTSIQDGQHPASRKPLAGACISLAQGLPGNIQTDDDALNAILGMLGGEKDHKASSPIPEKAPEATPPHHDPYLRWSQAMPADIRTALSDVPAISGDRPWLHTIQCGDHLMQTNGIICVNRASASRHLARVMDTHCDVHAPSRILPSSMDGIKAIHPSDIGWYARGDSIRAVVMDDVGKPMAMFNGHIVAALSAHVSHASMEIACLNALTETGLTALRSTPVLVWRGPDQTPVAMCLAMNCIDVPEDMLSRHVKSTS